MPNKALEVVACSASNTTVQTLGACRETMMAGTDYSMTPPGKLVFACSGAADVGAIADRAARDVSKAGHGKMFCSVGLGGKVGPILEATRAASTILAIDGCILDCTKRSLAEAGFEQFLHLRVTDLGMTKGETDVSDANISTVAERAKALLQ